MYIWLSHKLFPFLENNFNYVFQTYNTLNLTWSYLIKEFPRWSFFFQQWKNVYYDLIYDLHS